MPATRELFRALRHLPNDFRSRDVVDGQYKQIGPMEALKQFLGELEGEDPSAVIVRHTSGFFSRDFLAVHWQFWPKAGYDERVYKLPPSQRREVPSWLTSKGVGIEVDRSGTAYVRFTKSPIGWDYLRDEEDHHPLPILTQEEFLPSLCSARGMAESADDYRYGRGNSWFRLRLGEGKNWQILEI